MKAGFSSAIITPVRGIGLAGYFNKRPNRGVYDDVKVRVLLFENKGIVTGLAVFDLCGLSQDLFQAVRDAARKAGAEFADRMIISATHTHTGPELRRNLDDPGVRECIASIAEKTAAAIQEAYANLRPATLEIASQINNPLGYVRRFWMKNGTVVTNPGKLNPDIVKPESDFDRTVSVVAVRQEGRIAALLVNLANHGDTIGGDLVSADWFGRMERAIQYELGEDVPVLTLTDASGDVNHFDVTTDRDQTNYAEALRIGRGYGKIVLDMLPGLQAIPETEIKVVTGSVDLPYRTVSDKELADARKVLATVPESGKTGDITSEDLSRGDGTTLRLFAQRVLDCEGNVGKFMSCELVSIQFGRELTIVSLPGEPFNGIARAIRAGSPFKRTLIAELAQGRCGYIPMPECYERGGYETQPAGDTFGTDCAPRLIDAALKLLK